MLKPTILVIFAFLCFNEVHCNSTTVPLATAFTEVSPTLVPGNVTLLPTDQEIHEVLAFGDQVIFIISSKLASLPEDMTAIGERILVDIKNGLHRCEDDLRRNGTIWEYKVCSSSQLRYGISSFAGLTQGNAESGAARPRFFFM